jgi:hypothetical protein
MPNHLCRSRFTVVNITGLDLPEGSGGDSSARESLKETQVEVSSGWLIGMLGGSNHPDMSC